MEKLIKNNFIYLIYLLPAFLVLGPAIPDIIISLVAIFFIYYCLKNNKYFYFTNKLFYIYFLFWIIIVLGSAFSDYKLLSL